MSFKMIATWRMAYESFKDLETETVANWPIAELLVKAISYIEDYPFYKSVGCGGLPNEDGIVECDAAFMNGSTLAIGAVAGVTNVKNPVQLAQLLSHERFNCFLVGKGAEKYAIRHQLPFTNMLTARAHKLWDKKRLEIQTSNISPYDGHDTVGMVGLDHDGHMAAATSTSGLFFKREGRVGDSPLSGSGFYCDEQVGGACATGLGEDIMKGCLSFAIVQKMASGMNVQQACDEVLFAFERQLQTRFGKAGAMSVVAMDCNGNWGVATNVEFSFVVGDGITTSVYIANPDPNHERTIYELASQEFLDNYLRRIQAPID